MPYNSRAEVYRVKAERYDTKSNVKLGGFRSQLDWFGLVGFVGFMAYQPL